MYCIGNPRDVSVVQTVYSTQYGQAIGRVVQYAGVFIHLVGEGKNNEKLALL